MTELTLSHGELVRAGKVGTSEFVKGFSTREGSNSYYSGTWEELERLVEKHFQDNEPGTGSVDGDVLLVNVPAEGFHTSIVKIDETNKHLVEEVTEARVDGEVPVTSRIIRGLDKPPAKYAKIVIYRADVLAQDNDRSTDAEWEIVSVNAQNYEVVPMSPSTMRRNANHDEGGTYREYTDAEWAESEAFWAEHVNIHE